VTRVAAIDCGTNSIRLLIADLEAVGPLRDVHREMRVVRLGEGVDQTGALSAAALTRTFAAVDDYAELIRTQGATAIRFVATSATRDATNRQEFVDGVQSRLGVLPEVASGSEEAALTFAGATGELTRLPAPHLVVDIGGGSTEFVLGDQAGGVLAARSVNIGCVRMTERHLHDDPPTNAQISAVEKDLAGALDQAAEVVPLQDAATLVGVAGTVTTIAALALDLPEYDADRIHLSRISAADVERITERLLAMSRGERAALPVMHPGRVDVIGGGAMILRAIVRRTGVNSVVASEHDILDGIAYSLLPVQPDE
jgi:exopolyphosphatase/guanosine-5'-triphosphate,3'-diphosphate pyrophosphatase